MSQLDVLWAVGGRWERLPAQHLEEAAALAKTSTTWFRTGLASGPNLDAIGKALGLHELALEDAKNPRQRPKVEDYEGSTFIVVRTPDPQEELGWHPVGIFLGDGFVVTVADNVPEILRVEEHLLKPGGTSLSPERLVHSLLSSIMDGWSRFMDRLESEADELDEEGQLDNIRVVKRDVSTVRKVLQPIREAMVKLSADDHPYVTDDGRIYFRDVADRAIRLKERLDHVAQLTVIAQEAWFAETSHQHAEAAASQNAIVTRLTVVAALLLIPGLIAGLMGMNLPGAPQWPFWAVTGPLIGLTIAGLLSARFRGWL